MLFGLLGLLFFQCGERRKWGGKIQTAKTHDSDCVPCKIHNVTCQYDYEKKINYILLVFVRVCVESFFALNRCCVHIIFCFVHNMKMPL